MNVPKLKTVAITGTFLTLAAVVVWQQLKVRRLVAELTVLREHAEQASALRDENHRLEAQLRSASKQSQADSIELARLRGQVARIRQADQENARLRAERDRLAKEVKTSNTSGQDQDDLETPERRLQRAKGFFGRDLGMALIRAANANDGIVPAALIGPLFEVVESLSQGAEYDLRARQFELVYRGSLRDVKEIGETVLAREKEPVQLSNGQWTRLYVMADGSSRYIAAATQDGFAAREQEFWPRQPRPPEQ